MQFVHAVLEVDPVVLRYLPAAHAVNEPLIVNGLDVCVKLTDP
jgi:hypothetical protein